MLAALAVLVAVIAFGVYWARGDRFDLERWRDPQQIEYRARMYNDITSRVLRPDMARAEVRGRLGPADTVQPGYILYVSGHAPSLLLRFDADDRYTGYELIGD